jgi:hypothetical protein
MEEQNINLVKKKIDHLIAMSTEGRLQRYIQDIDKATLLALLHEISSFPITTLDNDTAKNIKEIILQFKQIVEKYKFDESLEDAPKNDKKASGTQAKQIAKRLLEEEQIILFKDQYNDGFAFLPQDKFKIVKLKSEEFKQLASYSVWNLMGIMPSNEVLRTVSRVLEGQAIFASPQYTLHVRIAEYDNAVWYDLGNGNVVRIDTDGWSIVNNPPILFRSFRHQLQQVHPLKGGNITDIITFININEQDEQLLFLVNLISYFIPNFPHPLLVLYGEQGAGKTTPLRLIKSLIDPSQLKTLTAPDTLREFVQIASHHYFYFLDNLSYLPNWLSDALARACTGDGFSKRELYSDDNDIIYSFQSGIGLNGINLVVQKADLLDRSILLGLERIPRNKRKTELEFWKAFEERKAFLLGAIFDVVAGALKEYKNIHLKELPRMSDFTLWGCAIAKALGYTQESFITAYYNNIDKQNDEAIEANPVGKAIVELMLDTDFWEGQPSELLSELDKITGKLKINTNSRDWPKSASSLSKKLQLVSVNLAESGIIVKRFEKARPRKISISKIRENTDNGDATSNNSKNESNPTSSVVEEKITNAVNNAVGENEANITLQTLATTPTVLSILSKEALLQKTEEYKALLLNDVDLQKQEKEARKKLNTLDKESPEYAEFYHVCFALRSEGEKRGLWGFIPSPNE